MLKNQIRLFLVANIIFLSIDIFSMSKKFSTIAQKVLPRSIVSRPSFASREYIRNKIMIDVIQKGDKEQLAELIRKGFSVNGTSFDIGHGYHHWAPLAYAVGTKNPEIIQQLIDAGAEIHFCANGDRYGNRISPEIFKLLEDAYKKKQDDYERYKRYYDCKEKIIEMQFNAIIYGVILAVASVGVAAGKVVVAAYHKVNNSIEVEQ